MKRILALSLAMFLAFFCVGSPIFAANAVDDELSISSTSTAEERAEIISALRDVEIDKVAFGLTNVDFSQLSIGNKVNHYELTDDGFSFMFYSYPLFYNGEVVMFAYHTSDTWYEISTYEANAIKEFGLDTVAVIYDAFGCYLYDGNDFELISNSGYVIEGRGNLEDYLSLSTDDISRLSQFEMINSQQDIEITSLVNSQDLGYSIVDEMAIPQSINRGYYACTVEYLAQTTSTSCWAACIAMVVNYINDSDYTVQDIIDMYPNIPSPGYSGANMNQIASIIRDDFNCGHYTSSETLLSESMYVTNIQNGYPVVAGFIVT